MKTAKPPTMIYPRPRAQLAVWILAVLTAGCGGGSDEASTPLDSATSAEVAPLPDAVAADDEAGGEVTNALELPLRRKRTPSSSGSSSSTTPTSGANCGLSDFQASVLARINMYRAAGANCRSGGRFVSTQALVWDSRLAQAATAHAQDMAARNYFSHTSPTGSTMVTRINATGYAWSTIGENIAAGYTTVNAVVDGWMASDGHCANLMNPNFKDAGMACAASSTSTYRSYWALDLGRQR